MTEQALTLVNLLKERTQQGLQSWSRGGVFLVTTVGKATLRLRQGVSADSYELIIQDLAGKEVESLHGFVGPDYQALSELWAIADRAERGADSVIASLIADLSATTPPSAQSSGVSSPQPKAR